MSRKFVKLAWLVFVICNLYSVSGAYSWGINSYIPLTEDEDVGQARYFLNETFLAFVALSLFPLLFLASAVGGSLIQWYWSHHAYSKCDEHYYGSSGYGGGHSSYGGDSYGHGGYGHDHKRSDSGYDYDYDYNRSFQKRNTQTDFELSGM